MTDFNENPVVSPDLDLDFGLPLRVFKKYVALIRVNIKTFDGVNQKV